jgi:hypothetical protein
VTIGPGEGQPRRTLALDHVKHAGIIGRRAAGQMETAEQERQIAVGEKGDPVGNLEQQIAFVVDDGAVDLADCFADMRFEPVFCHQMQDPRGVLEFDEHPLWAVLHEVVAVLVMAVLAVEKILEAGMVSTSPRRRQRPRRSSDSQP